MVLVLAMLALPAAALADDGYDSAFAQAVRAATETYRLVYWAKAADYVQTTDYIDGVGVMFTNHARFDPSDLAHPTLLVYDESGRLVACGYQFANRTVPSAFGSVPASAWYDIPQHVHYNALQNGQMHYGQAPWTSNAQPTADTLNAQGLLPAGSSLQFAFVHPAVRAIIVWAWLPNSDGLYAGENALLP
ncbi:MAG: hypothetical protein JO219_08595 [Candidatus Eremiobacteraeota bacterium]|nr:hypothetical protein [Candidatus Eremiobacteraeota bacterium]MBV8366565.1 hypothetical protein [Candidatus Eremiobacteraeota bacterium]